jgi:2-dehydropantoate 2-reductase
LKIIHFLQKSKKTFNYRVILSSVNEEKTILLVGLGAIGSVIYSRLERKEYKTVCLTSEEGSKIIRTRGLVVELVDDQTPTMHTCEVYDELPEKYVFKNIILTSKSWLNRSLASKLSPHIEDSASILFFQNGLNIEKPFLYINKGWKLIRSITSHAALREGHNHAIEANLGETRIGGINIDDKEQINFWKDILIEIGIPTVLSQNIEKDIWLKTIVNCSLGSLGAISGLKNGEILKEPSLNALTRRLIEEILPLAPREHMINFYEAYSLIEKIVEQTSDHKSSMLQDIERGSKTEIETLNGEIARIAQEKNAKTPVNSALIEIVKKISEDNYPRELAILDLRSIY